MGSGGEELGNAGGLEALLGESEGGTEARTASTNDDAIVGVVDHVVSAGEMPLGLARGGDSISRDRIISPEGGRVGGSPPKGHGGSHRGSLMGKWSPGHLILTIIPQNKSSILWAPKGGRKCTLEKLDLEKRERRILLC